MIPTQSLENYPIFGSNATKVQPDNAKMAAGYQQADVLPAEWMNWKWNKDSRLITELQEGLESVETEINNLLTGVGITPAEATTNQLFTAIKKMTYPVGSVYQNMLDPTNPATLLGFGTWAQINDKFLVAAAAASFTDGTNVPKYSGTNTGGSTTYTLSMANIPSHNHEMAHQHYTNIVHSHSITDPGHAHWIQGGPGVVGNNEYAIMVVNGQYGAAPYPPVWEWQKAVAAAYTGISVNSTGDAWMISTNARHTSNPAVDRNYTGDTGQASPTAISIVPSYQAVYTWYRTA